MGDLRSIVAAFVLCALYVLTSASLISFNKFLLGKFPHVLVLTVTHMFVSSVMSLILYVTAPGLFPSIEEVRNGGRHLEVAKLFIPLGACFACALAASNEAYLYCTVPFLQFMKESNIAIVFLIACAYGLESFDRVRGLLVVWILLGSWMCVKGDLSFSLIGFAIQALSQVAECTKNVLGQCIMSGKDGSVKLDPFSYTLFMSPVCLSILLAALACQWDPMFLLDIKANWYLLIPNALLAFCLNVIIAIVISQCSAVGFILAGITKDIVIVLASSHLFAVQVGPLQYFSFSITLAGCFTWSMYKVAPDGAVARILLWFTCSPSKTTVISTPEETKPLMAAKCEQRV